MESYVALTGKKYPRRYFEGLPRPLQIAREVELELRKSRPAMGITDAYAKPRKSSYTRQFKEKYGHLPADLGVFSKEFRVPHASLKAVFNKGLKAWQTSGSRPGANAHQWAWARVYKFLLIHAGHIPMKPNDPDRSHHYFMPRN